MAAPFLTRWTLDGLESQSREDGADVIRRPVRARAVATRAGPFFVLPTFYTMAGASISALLPVVMMPPRRPSGGHIRRARARKVLWSPLNILWFLLNILRLPPALGRAVSRPLLVPDSWTSRGAAPAPNVCSCPRGRGIMGRSGAENRFFVLGPHVRAVSPWGPSHVSAHRLYACRCTGCIPTYVAPPLCGCWACVRCTGCIATHVPSLSPVLVVVDEPAHAWNLPQASKSISHFTR